MHTLIKRKQSFKILKSLGESNLINKLTLIFLHIWPTLIYCQTDKIKPLFLLSDEEYSILKERKKKDELTKYLEETLIGNSLLFEMKESYNNRTKTELDDRQNLEKFAMYSLTKFNDVKIIALDAAKKIDNTITEDDIKLIIHKIHYDKTKPLTEKYLKKYMVDNLYHQKASIAIEFVYIRNNKYNRIKYEVTITPAEYPMEKENTHMVFNLGEVCPPNSNCVKYEFTHK